MHGQRQQAGAERVVTRCRVSGNPLLVLHQRKVLETLVSKLTFGFFCSATKETRRRGGGTALLAPQGETDRHIPSCSNFFKFPIDIPPPGRVRGVVPPLRRRVSFVAEQKKPKVSLENNGFQCLPWTQDKKLIATDPAPGDDTLRTRLLPLSVLT